MPPPKTPKTTPPSSPVPLLGNGQYMPPSPHWYLCRVRDGDSWLSLAGHCDISAKELVEQNFRTTNPDQVNWYLEKYVGCKKITPDGSNYCFSDAASPGLIYTPVYVDRTGSKMPILVKQVQQALSSPHVRHLRVTMRGYAFEPWAYPQVLSLVNKGLIRLRVNPGMGADGRYDPSANALEFRAPGLTQSNMAMVIHEATHAACDITGTGAGMRRDYSELLAYTAQHLYFHMATGQYLLGHGDEAQIFAAATELVIDIADYKLRHPEKAGSPYTPKADLVEGLLAAIRGSARYANYSGVVKYDGVPDGY